MPCIVRSRRSAGTTRTLAIGAGCRASTSRHSRPTSSRTPLSRWWYVRHALTQIDPHHTMTTGKVDIGAFRTFPADYRAEERASQHTSLPTHKAEDYGAHADRYYALDVELFTTSAERPLFALLWNEYWAHTLCSSPSLLQRMLSLQHTNELVTQLSQARARIANAGIIPGGASYTQAGRSSASAHTTEPAEQLAAALERRAAEQPLAKLSTEAYVPATHPATTRRRMRGSSCCARRSNRPCLVR